jgi:hypothetical protein
MTEAGNGHAIKRGNAIIIKAHLPPSWAEPRSSYFLPNSHHLTSSSSLFSSCPFDIETSNNLPDEAHDLAIAPEPIAHTRGCRMTSYLSRLSLMPGFPEYTGPHKVGTIDVELPVSDLDCPSPSPDESISTVQYRIFYPCQPDAKGKKNVNWLPAPQRGYISAYTKFLGAGSMLAELISYVCCNS